MDRLRQRSMAVSHRWYWQHKCNVGFRLKFAATLSRLWGPLHKGQLTRYKLIALISTLDILISLAKLSKASYWLCAIFGALLLGSYWMVFFVAFVAGEPFSHTTWWNAEVGTYLLLAVLVVATPAYILFLWTQWPNRRTGMKGSD